MLLAGFAKTATVATAVLKPAGKRKKTSKTVNFHNHDITQVHTCTLNQIISYQKLYLL